MSCERGTVEDIYFVRWIKPEVADSECIIEEVKNLCGARGQKLRYVAIIGERVEPPGEDVRASMKRNIDDLLRYCETVHLVIEGRGFRRAMARSIGTSIFLLSRNRGRTFAHDTVEHALEKIGLVPTRVESVLAEARERQLVTG